MTRTAISPRLAIRIFFSTDDNIALVSQQNTNQSRKWHVTRVAETGSTNTDLLKSGADGAPDRTVLRADFQSAGRGRLDRVWEAPPGANLLVSMLLREVPRHVHQLTQAVALSAVQVARDTCGVEVTMKWPNDLLIGDVKVAGILAQAGRLDGTGVPEFVVVGLGLNIGWAPPGATCLADNRWSHPLSPDEFLHEMLPVVDAHLAMGSDDLHAAYLAGLSTIGQRVRAEMHGDVHVIGRAVAVEPDGRLTIIDDCAVTHRIDTADVVHLRPHVD